MAQRAFWPPKEVRFKHAFRPRGLWRGAATEVASCGLLLLLAAASAQNMVFLQARLDHPPLIPYSPIGLGSAFIWALHVGGDPAVHVN